MEGPTALAATRSSDGSWSLSAVGLIFFGVALVSASFLIADVILGWGWGLGFAAVVAGLEVALWLVVPLAYREGRG
jgi:hypothetical protein